MGVIERGVGYKLGISALSVATLASAALIGFTAFRGDGSPVYLEPIPVCMVRGGPRLGTPADFIMNCPEDFRLATLSFVGLSVVLILTVLVSDLRSKALGLTVYRYLPRLLVASLTVGIGLLIGIYVSEYFGGMGKLNKAYVAALPVIATLVHFPPRKLIFLVVPVAFFGFVSLIMAAFLTGIPLD
jgi:hypothetical protein